MGQQLKISDKVSNSDKVSKSDKVSLFVQKATKISKEFTSIFDDVIIKGIDESCYYILSVHYFGYYKMYSLNTLCKKYKVTYFCLYNTEDKSFDFYLYI